MATKGSEIKDLDFDRMTALHRSGRRGLGVYAAVLILAGLALLFAGIQGYLPWLVGVIAGIMTLAVSILPIRDAIERGERIEGLQVLKEEWKSLVELGDAGRSQRDQFLALLRRLYN